MVLLPLWYMLRVRDGNLWGAIKGAANKGSCLGFRRSQARLPYGSDMRASPQTRGAKALTRQVSCLSGFRASGPAKFLTKVMPDRLLVKCVWVHHACPRAPVPLRWAFSFWTWNPTDFGIRARHPVLCGLKIWMVGSLHCLRSQFLLCFLKEWVTDGAHLDSRSHCKPHRLVGKSGLLPISRWIFLYSEDLTVFKTPLPFRQVFFQLQENSLFSASVLQELAVSVTRPVELSQTGQGCGSGQHGESGVRFNGASVVLITRLLPTI